MKCLSCGKRISDWQVLKSVPRGYLECDKCGVRHRVVEKGMGLAWLIPLLGVLAAIALSVLFVAFEVSIVVQAVLLVAAIVAVVKLGIHWGVKLGLHSTS